MSFTSLISAPVTVQEAGIKIATRQNLNFVSGAVVTDDPANNSADIVIGFAADIDGGHASSVYLMPSQILNGGNA